MHLLPPPPNMDISKQWALYLVTIAWVIYQTWQGKIAAKTAADAKTKAETNETRLNGHAQMIDDTKAEINKVSRDVTPPAVLAAMLTQSGPPATSQTVNAPAAQTVNLSDTTPPQSPALPVGVTEAQALERNTTFYPVSEAADPATASAPALPPDPEGSSVTPGEDTNGPNS